MKNRCAVSFGGSLVVAAALFVTACAPSGAEAPGATATPASSPATRALSQAELGAARLTEDEADGYDLLLGDETLEDMKNGEEEVAATPTTCERVLEVLFRGRGDRAAGYTGSTLHEAREFAPDVYVSLTSYPSGGAAQVLAMMREWLPKCRSVVFRSRFGDSARAKLADGEPIRAGDDSISVDLSYSFDGTDSHYSYILVRSGETISCFKADSGFSSSLPPQQKKRLMPVIERDLVARQVAKIERAYRT